MEGKIMVNKTLENQGVTKECAEYCARSIIPVSYTHLLINESSFGSK